MCNNGIDFFSPALTGTFLPFRSHTPVSRETSLASLDLDPPVEPLIPFNKEAFNRLFITPWHFFSTERESVHVPCSALFSFKYKEAYLVGSYAMHLVNKNYVFKDIDIRFYVSSAEILYEAFQNTLENLKIPYTSNQSAKGTSSSYCNFQLTLENGPLERPIKIDIVFSVEKKEEMKAFADTIVVALPESLLQQSLPLENVDLSVMAGNKCLKSEEAVKQVYENSLLGKARIEPREMTPQLFPKLIDLFSKGLFIEQPSSKEILTYYYEAKLFHVYVSKAKNFGLNIAERMNRQKRENGGSFPLKNWAFFWNALFIFTREQLSKNVSLFSLNIEKKEYVESILSRGVLASLEEDLLLKSFPDLVSFSSALEGLEKWEDLFSGIAFYTLATKRGIKGVTIRLQKEGKTLYAGIGYLRSEVFWVPLKMTLGNEVERHLLENYTFNEPCDVQGNLEPVLVNFKDVRANFFSLVAEKNQETLKKALFFYIPLSVQKTFVLEQDKPFLIFLLSKVMALLEGKEAAELVTLLENWVSFSYSLKTSREGLFREICKDPKVFNFMQKHDRNFWKAHFSETWTPSQEPFLQAIFQGKVRENTQKQVAAFFGKWRESGQPFAFFIPYLESLFSHKLPLQPQKVRGWSLSFREEIGAFLKGRLHPEEKKDKETEAHKKIAQKTRGTKDFYIAVKANFINLSPQEKKQWIADLVHFFKQNKQQDSKNWYKDERLKSYWKENPKEAALIFCLIFKPSEWKKEADTCLKEGSSFLTLFFQEEETSEEVLASSLRLCLGEIRAMKREICRHSLSLDEMEPFREEGIIQLLTDCCIKEVHTFLLGASRAKENIERAEILNRVIPHLNEIIEEENGVECLSFLLEEVEESDESLKVIEKIIESFKKLKKANIEVEIVLKLMKNLFSLHPEKEREFLEIIFAILSRSKKPKEEILKDVKIFFTQTASKWERARLSALFNSFSLSWKQELIFICGAVVDQKNADDIYSHLTSTGKIKEATQVAEAFPVSIKYWKASVRAQGISEIQKYKLLKKYKNYSISLQSLLNDYIREPFSDKRVQLDFFLFLIQSEEKSEGLEFKIIEKFFPHIKHSTGTFKERKLALEWLQRTNLLFAPPQFERFFLQALENSEKEEEFYLETFIELSQEALKTGLKHFTASFLERLFYYEQRVIILNESFYEVAIQIAILLAHTPEQVNFRPYLRALLRHLEANKVNNNKEHLKNLCTLLNSIYLTRNVSADDRKYMALQVFTLLERFSNLEGLFLWKFYEDAFCVNDCMQMQEIRIKYKEVGLAIFLGEVNPPISAWESFIRPHFCKKSHLSEGDYLSLYKILKESKPSSGLYVRLEGEKEALMLRLALHFQSIGRTLQTLSGSYRTSFCEHHLHQYGLGVCILNFDLFKALIIARGIPSLWEALDTYVIRGATQEVGLPFLYKLLEKLEKNQYDNPFFKEIKNSLTDLNKIEEFLLFFKNAYEPFVLVNRLVDREEGFTGRRLGNLIEALEVFKRYSNEEIEVYRDQREASILYDLFVITNFKRLMQLKGVPLFMEEQGSKGNRLTQGVLATVLEDIQQMDILQYDLFFTGEFYADLTQDSKWEIDNALFIRGLSLEEEYEKRDGLNSERSDFFIKIFNNLESYHLDILKKFSLKLRRMSGEIMTRVEKSSSCDLVHSVTSWQEYIKFMVGRSLAFLESSEREFQEDFQENMRDVLKNNQKIYEILKAKAEELGVNSFFVKRAIDLNRTLLWYLNEYVAAKIKKRGDLEDAIACQNWICHWREYLSLIPLPENFFERLGIDFLPEAEQSFYKEPTPVEKMIIEDFEGRIKDFASSSDGTDMKAIYFWNQVENVYSRCILSRLFKQNKKAKEFAQLEATKLVDLGPNVFEGIDFNSELDEEAFLAENEDEASLFQ